MKENYLHSTRKQFEYYKMLGEKTFAQLSDEELFWQYHPDSNSVAIIVNHLWGNMKSRWTNFLTSDGEKDFRNRDMEFEDIIKTRADLLEKWEDGWASLFQAIDSVNENNFDTTIYIRNQAHTIIEAMNRQMGHYAYHVGQIVFIGRMLRKNDWKSLSIPKGGSKSFNQMKSSKGKHDGHFTDDLK